MKIYFLIVWYWDVLAAGLFGLFAHFRVHHGFLWVG